MKCTVDSLAAAITKEISEYSQDITDNLKAEVKQVAKDCVKDIQNSSPILTGSYQKGWTTKVNYEGSEDIRITVHNKTDYQIAHLLEYGFAKKTGGRVEGKPHIAVAERAAAEKLGKRVKVII